MLDKKPIGTGIQNFAGIPASLMETLSGGGTSLQALLIGLLTIVVIALGSSLRQKTQSAAGTTGCSGCRGGRWTS